MAAKTLLEIIPVIAPRGSRGTAEKMEMGALAFKSHPLVLPLVSIIFIEISKIGFFFNNF